MHHTQGVWGSSTFFVYRWFVSAQQSGKQAKAGYHAHHITYHKQNKGCYTGKKSYAAAPYII